MRRTKKEEKKEMRKEERRKESKEKGITLVALVITVVVLIILAGVTISLVVGDNGIITKAQEAKQNMANGTSEEQESLQNMLNAMNEIESGNGGNVPPKPFDPTEPGNWDDEKVSDIITEGDKNVPIPKGYVVSKATGENTIDGGLVIYEGEEEVTDANVSEAQTSRNQYVWIPVEEINDMVMCKSKTADTQCHIIRVDDQASPNGFYLKCETHNSTDFAGKLYEGTLQDAGGGIYSYIMDFSKIDQVYNPNSGNREPAIVTGNDTGDGEEYDGASDNYHGLGTAQAFLQQLNNDFNDMVKSVYSYGGFYVGRYEMGEGGSTKKGQTVVCNDSDENNWYGMYKELRQKGSAINRELIWRMPV